MKKVKQRLDYDSMLHEYKANIGAHQSLATNKENSQKKPKGSKSDVLNKKLIDMKNTTAEILRNKKINKKTNHEKPRREQITSSNLSLKSGGSNQKFLKIESSIKPVDPEYKSTVNTTRNPYLSSNLFDKSNVRTEQCLTHRVEKPEELRTVSNLKSEGLVSPNIVTSPFFLSYEAGTKSYVHTTPQEALGTEYTNHETELRYDSETCEVSFSNEKTKKTKKGNKVALPVCILKYV